MALWNGAGLMRGSRPLLIGIAFLAATGCGGTKFTSVQPSIVIEYFITTTGFASVDSVTYDNGLGVMQKVRHPNLGIIATLTPAPPASVVGTAWVTLQPSATATFKESWTTRTEFGADSLVLKAGATATSGPIALGRHTVS